MTRSKPLSRGSQLKRTPLSRGTGPARGKRSILGRTKPLRWRPSSAGARWWRERRAEVLARDGNACVECGATGRLDVAHRVALGAGRSRYRADEPLNALWNLRALCRPCHRLEEEGRVERPRREYA